ncbi:MAG: ATP-grasp domain-containing protein [Planctomycetes bacterium]|nr:ATP-grasp domain-containing protein [Planctomycetota bacterium]
MKILIFATNDALALELLQSLSVVGIKADIISPYRLSCAALSRHGGNCFTCNIENLLRPDCSFADIINSYCSDKNIDVIIPVDILPTACLAKIKHMITTVTLFPIPKLEHILLLNNKWRFKQLLDQLGISTPHTTIVQSKEDVLSRSFEFPEMIKPLELDGGVGIRLLNSTDDVQAYFSKKNNFNHPPLLIQEYIPGLDICVSTLSENGKMLYWTMQKKLKCGNIEFIENPDVLQATQKILSALKYTGWAHFDTRLDSRDNSIRFLECNPRVWGSLAASTFAGVNLAAFGIALGLGHEMPTEIKYRKGLQLQGSVIYKSMTKMLISRQIPFSWISFCYLWHAYCDPLVLLFLKTRWLRKRLAKIFIPGRIRLNKKRKLEKELMHIPPLSAIETYASGTIIH